MGHFFVAAGRTQRTLAALQVISEGGDTEGLTVTVDATPGCEQLIISISGDGDVAESPENALDDQDSVGGVEGGHGEGGGGGGVGSRKKSGASSWWG